jgi:hypothetical protein
MFETTKKPLNLFQKLKSKKNFTATNESELTQKPGAYSNIGQLDPNLHTSKEYTLK